MESERENGVKKAKAKLYNLKSGVEGLIQLVDSGVVDPEKVPDAAAALVAKMVKGDPTG